MKTLYIDCGMGAAGDMLTSALLELVGDENAFADKINSLGLKGVKVSYDKVSKCGISATSTKVLVDGVEEESIDVDEHHMHAHNHTHAHDHDQDHNHDHAHTHDYDHNHSHEYVHDHDNTHEHTHAHDHDQEHNHDHAHHHHTHLSDIKSIITALNVSDKVKTDVLSIYEIIANAESKAHGVSVEEIHFHEVGMMDAITDVLSVALLMEMISPDKVMASPIHVGSGKVKCAHGIMPVPAPATANILKGIPIYSSNIKGELCTPTGAAILAYYVDKFDNMPVASVEKVGYGAGKKDFESANVIRAMLLETKDAKDSIVKLECNVDDMTGEELGYAIEKLMSEGARDVYVLAVTGKKGRPGHELNVITDEASKEQLVPGIFKYTSTLGIREVKCERYILDRHIESVEIDGENVRKKISSGYGVNRSKLEFEDLKIIAEKRGISISEARNLI
ncbi:MAG: nickel pincer cofactor biosynthesis protein LarC [Lachnospiraceae bacterium]|nr:nickel pincer cofactor biosynthesis protein LarC [Lachnospiraceae bacterium]